MPKGGQGAKHQTNNKKTQPRGPDAHFCPTKSGGKPKKMLPTTRKTN